MATVTSGAVKAVNTAPYGQVETYSARLVIRLTPGSRDSRHVEPFHHFIKILVWSKCHGVVKEKREEWKLGVWVWIRTEAKPFKIITWPRVCEWLYAHLGSVLYHNMFFVNIPMKTLFKENDCFVYIISHLTLSVRSTVCPLSHTVAWVWLVSLWLTGDSVCAFPLSQRTRPGPKCEVNLKPEGKISDFQMSPNVFTHTPVIRSVMD